MEEETKEIKEAYNYCIFLLSKRDYSKYKMTQKLESRKYSEECIDYVIEKVINQNYLREHAYTRMRIKTLLLKGFSNFYILQKLNEEKITSDEDEINGLRVENHLSLEDSLEYLVNKKLRNKIIPSEYEEKAKLKNKVLRFLISKGHSYQNSTEALNNYLNNQEQ